MDLYETSWAHVKPDGAICSQLEPCEAGWSAMEPYEVGWTRVKPNGALWSHFWDSIERMAKIRFGV